MKKENEKKEKLINELEKKSNKELSKTDRLFRNAASHDAKFKQDVNELMNELTPHKNKTHTKKLEESVSNSQSSELGM